MAIMVVMVLAFHTIQANR